jgi:surfactin synthase thioesterase subunit
MGNVTSPWIRRYHPAPDAAVRLICFPHAGGSASYFHPVSRRFSPDVDVVALQYPGRQDRRTEPCITDLGELADRLTAEVVGLDNRPTVFFGHSMGAALAFETIWRLERDGEPGTRSLIASGRRGPSTFRDDHVYRESDERLIQEIKALDGTSSELLEDDEILRMALPSIRADYQAIETYRCPADRRITAPITVLTGDADPKTTIDEAQVWREHTKGSTRLKVFRGGHFFLQEQPAAVNDVIAEEIGALKPN